MKLSTRSRYGTRMVLDLALHGSSGVVPIHDVSKRRGLSVKYLEKLIRPLKDGGIIESRRGPNGGHRLARKPEKITVGEVVRILEGDSCLTECVNDICTCPIASDCVTRKVWKKATEAMMEVLDEVTFADLMKQARSVETAGFICC